MKQFILTVTRWPIAMFELIPGAWRIGYYLGGRKAKREGNRIVAEWNVFAGLLVKILMTDQKRSATNNPKVIGMVGGQASGKTYMANLLLIADDAIHVDVNMIRYCLEQDGKDLGLAHKIGTLVAAGLVSRGYSVILDFSCDMAFTRGYVEEFVSSRIENYNISCKFEYRQNRVTWEQVIEGFVYLNIPAWYQEAVNRRFPGLTAMDLRIQEATRTRWFFYWPNGQLICRKFPGFEIVHADLIKGIRQLSQEEVSSVGGSPRD